MKAVKEYERACRPRKEPLRKSISIPAINPVIVPVILPSFIPIYTIAIITRSGVIFSEDKDISQMKVFCTRINTTRTRKYFIYANDTL